MKIRNLTFSIIMLIISGYFIFSGFEMGEQERLWPFFFATIIAILSIVLFIQSLTFKKSSNDSKSEHFKESVFDRQTIIIIVMLVLYLLVMKYLGFLITTFLFLFATFVLVKYGSIIKKLIISFSTSVILTILFEFLLGVSIPQGIFANVF